MLIPVPSRRSGKEDSVKTTIEEQQQLALTQGRDRMDMYTAIHKALRAMMCDALVALGRLDHEDDQEVVRTSAQLFELLELCGAHMLHENTFVHEPMQAQAPGSADAADADGGARGRGDADAGAGVPDS